MRILLAGATGAIGRRLLPLLLDSGHQVVATSRSAERLARLRERGAQAVRLDVFDRAAVERAVAEAAPDAIMHQLTALADVDLAANARIRREGTRNLVDAAQRAGVGRIVAQSISWAYQGGDAPATEATPLDDTIEEPRATTVGGLRALEQAAAELPEHVVLRYGILYGPGTWYAPGGLMAQRLHRGELAAGAAVSSFLHVEDAALAALAALDWPSGTVNIVDDEPAPARDWVPALAAALGAPAPAAVPATGDATGDGTGRAGWERGADNTLARVTRGWRPTRASWRDGFADFRSGKDR
ncbi:nucleoside-diphosphate-sugar epimerase [Kitasatospora sp. GAS204A]|uniref:NAD-dependent epimerase/dehydratase family protein n=1 Tax=unclassified Kitasatospora TaxID=2633591 RepID=UPI0024764A63|nr:NAD(P)-dependent oxidoreductase [Kitasatospora sp. GAS204B]MDH6119950.1 nucleoside-diphosphate-sugar epimerase [Kitasatospora sp. GAS204B]